VLGASKQLAERYIARLAGEQESGRFLTVRFGNVLGSSGSVIPTFDRQLRRGGPITLTDPNVTRYFMTVEEACQLVIQASALGQSGDTLVLDMGPPVRIMDLARKMIHLMGKEVADEEVLDENAVAIRVIGLRPGEKMHEQLFETTDVRGTQHPRIQTSLHTYEPDALSPGRIDRLRRLLDEGDEAAVISLMWTICGQDPADRSGNVVSLSSLGDQ
jgi:FlaA1/EpsC-like NDP-sugar epimerase